MGGVEMNIIYASAEECPGEAARLVLEREEGVIVNIGDKLWCACGQFADIREDVCAENDIGILRGHWLGGANVVFPGDLSIMEVRYGPSCFGEECLRAVCRYLGEDKGLPVCIDGNDLMLWDRDTKIALKVGSHGSNWVGELTESVVHFSINMDLSLVNRICAKPMVKTPGALSKYGVTAEELWAVVLTGITGLEE